MSRPRNCRRYALLMSVGMVVFALSAHRGALWPGRILGLALAVFALARGISLSWKASPLLALARFPTYRLAYIPLCLALGLVLAGWYRLALHGQLLPEKVSLLVVLAMAIGAFEELVYRGFVQGCFQASGWLLACLGGAAAHTAYKCALFALPDVAVRADLLALGVATFIVGMLFALLREAFGSVLFPVLAHVAFDALSYADLDSIPWWVW